MNRDVDLSEDQAGKLDALVDLRNLAEERLTTLKGFDSLDEDATERHLADLEVVLHAYLRALASMPPRVLARHRGLTVGELELLEEHVAPLEQIVDDALPDLERDDLPRAIRGEYDLDPLTRFRQRVYAMESTKPESATRERAISNVLEALEHSTSAEELLGRLREKQGYTSKKAENTTGNPKERLRTRSQVYGHLANVLADLLEEGKA